jgi:hypothetical protein
MVDRSPHLGKMQSGDDKKTKRDGLPSLFKMTSLS